MTSKTMQLGKNSLLSLYGKMEIRITRLCSARKTKLFCKKHEALITPKFSSEHSCLRPKRTYINGEGKRIVIFCPHLMTLKGEPFYNVHESIIYESLEGIYQIDHEFKHEPQKPQPLEKEEKEDLFKRQVRNLAKLKLAGKQLTSGSA